MVLGKRIFWVFLRVRLILCSMFCVLPSSFKVACPGSGLRVRHAGTVRGRSPEAGGRSPEAGGRRQEAGVRRQEAGGRRQEAGGRVRSRRGGGEGGGEEFCTSQADSVVDLPCSCLLACQFSFVWKLSPCSLESPTAFWLAVINTKSARTHMACMHASCMHTPVTACGGGAGVRVSLGAECAESAGERSDERLGELPTHTRTHARTHARTRGLVKLSTRHHPCCLMQRARARAADAWPAGQRASERVLSRWQWQWQ